MNLKSYNQYLNEDLAGQYNYYGAGSLYPIVKKLQSEGKNAKVIYVYLTTLGIDEERKQKVINQVFLGESIDYETIQNDMLDEEVLNEDDKIYFVVKNKTSDKYEVKTGSKNWPTSKTGTHRFNNPEEANTEADKLNEGSLFEEDKKVSQSDIDNVLNASPQDLAQGVDPKKAKPDTDLKKSLDKLKDKPEDTDKKDDNPAKANLDALQAVLKDAEKLQKIKEILAESSLYEGVTFKNTKDFEKFLEEIDGMPESAIKKIMGSGYIDTPGMWDEEKEDYHNDIVEYMKSNMGKAEFERLKAYWESNIKK